MTDVKHSLTWIKRNWQPWILCLRWFTKTGFRIYGLFCLQIKKLFQVSKTHTLSFRYTNVTANGRLKCKTGSKLRRSAFTLGNCKAVDFSSAFVPVVLLQSFPSSFFLQNHEHYMQSEYLNLINNSQTNKIRIAIELTENVSFLGPLNKTDQLKCQ